MLKVRLFVGTLNIINSKIFRHVILFDCDFRN